MKMMFKKISVSKYLRNGIANAAAIYLIFVSYPACSQSSTPEIVVVSASEDAEGHTEASMNTGLLQALEKHAVENITRKTRAALAAQGITNQFPPLQSSSTYTMIGGRKLAIIKLRNECANMVAGHGIIGDEFRRVACARSREYSKDIPVFYGACGESVRTHFQLKGLPEPLILK